MLGVGVLKRNSGRWIMARIIKLFVGAVILAGIAFGAYYFM